MNIDEIYELHCDFAQMLKEVKDQVKGNRFVSKENSLTKITVYATEIFNCSKAFYKNIEEV